jgi:hypothetical protein
VLARTPRRFISDTLQTYDTSWLEINPYTILFVRRLAGEKPLVSKPFIA